MCHSRTLLLTTGGRKVGLGHRCIQPGDSICFLSGAAVPLLMRPHPHDLLQWLLVGETYVNGLAYASNDCSVSEDFEALRIVAPRELQKRHRWVGVQCYKKTALGRRRWKRLPSYAYATLVFVAHIK